MRLFARSLVILILVLFAFGLFFPTNVFASIATDYKYATGIVNNISYTWTNINNVIGAPDGATAQALNSTGLLFLTFDGFSEIPRDSSIISIDVKATFHGTGQWTVFFRQTDSYRSACRGVTFIPQNNITLRDYYVNIPASSCSSILTTERIRNGQFLLHMVRYSGVQSFTVDAVGIRVNYEPGAIPTLTPTATPTPTPTPIPGQEPFLDLPWDYEGKGLSFSEAALSINSYFDHEYPLLSSELSEPDLAKNTITSFRGEFRINFEYSSHDGYDYARRAKVNIGDPVLAAAGGIATFINSCLPCGNTIFIDHENGYQTRYLHLQKDGLITATPGEKIRVSAGQMIGKVGATGNVSPGGNEGAHIHFAVFEDKNKDGNFDDNIPDGVTDPFGWQSKEPDPWPLYTFFYNGQNRTGNKSYYLWKKKIDNLDVTLTSNGGVFDTGKYKVNFPQGSTNQNLNLSMVAAPIVKTLDNLRSVGTSIIITATDSLGNLITNFSKLFSIGVDFSSLDLSRYNQDTLSIYSSTDGQSWKKETTVIDFIKKTATVNLDHLTQFALMAERADTIAPIANAILDGQEGQENWFRSDVSVNLTAKDNEGGLGVDYTLYKKDDGDWETYEKPLIFTTEGHHKIEFYSADNDENIETKKLIEFDIDKAIPEARIFIDQGEQDLIVEGIDKNEIMVGKSDNLETKKKDYAIYTIKDLAGNTLRLDIRERDKEKKDKLRIYSIQYNQNPPIELQDNKLIVEYKGKKNKLNVGEQRFEVKKEIKIRIKYDSKKDKSTIITKVKGAEKVKEIKDGLILLQLVTEKGTLNYSY